MAAHCLERPIFSQRHPRSCDTRHVTWLRGTDDSYPWTIYITCPRFHCYLVDSPLDVVLLNLYLIYLVLFVFFTQNRRYRFRMISNGFMNCPIQVSVDNHTLLVIASDGNPVQPLEGIPLAVIFFDTNAIWLNPMRGPLKPNNWHSIWSFYLIIWCDDINDNDIIFINILLNKWKRELIRSWVFFRSLAVDSLVISAGERFDFVLMTTQPVSSYWIRLHGLMDCNVHGVYQAAILQYDGAPDTEPAAVLSYENTKRPGKVRRSRSLLFQCEF